MLQPPVSPGSAAQPAAISPIKPRSPLMPLADSPGEEMPVGVKLRATDDPDALRTGVYDSVLAAASSMPPAVSNTHTLKLTDLHYAEDDPEFNATDEKKAILSGSSLSRRLRGTWRLFDNGTGGEIAERKATVANVPAILRDGSFLRGGTRYTMGVQQRLRPGAYARYRKNGEAELHVNARQGTGRSHRYVLEPETGHFSVHVEGAKIPLVPLLTSLGVTRDQMESAWGKELTDKNFAKQDPKAIGKFYDRFVPKSQQNAEDRSNPEMVQAKIREAFEKIELDDEVVGHTLGRATGKVDADNILRGTTKTLRMLQGQEDADDRDNLAFASYHGAPEIFAERFIKDYGRFRKELLYKASRKGTLDNVPSGALDKYINAAIFRSGLAQGSEEINPFEILAAGTKVTRFGEGGLPDTLSAPDESREVSPSQFGFIDAVVSPETLRIGIDGFLARDTFIGDDNRLYSKLLDSKTGKTVLRSPNQLLNSTTAIGASPIPGWELAMQKGKLRMVKEGTAEYRIPSMEDTFGQLASFTPMKSGMFGQRTSMASRMAAQALAIDNAEAPLVQTGVPGDADESFEERLGVRLGAIRAEERGRVLEVSPDHILVRYAHGKDKKFSLDNNRPGARKSVFHHDPMVSVGQEVEPNQMLAKSNYVDDKGTAALGTNARTALMAWDDAFEDGIVVSQSFADRVRVQQAYKHRIQPGEGEKVDKKSYLQVFGNRYTGDQLKAIDNDGVIRIGTTVKSGDPLILGVRKRDGAKTRVHRQSKMDFGDSSIRWDHHSEGVVTDVFHSEKGSQVVVRSSKSLEEGDKLCYDELTEVLTRTGWKLVADLRFDDEICCRSEDGGIRYDKPTKLYQYATGGRMYRIESQQIDLFVTASHNMFVQRRNGKAFELLPTTAIAGKRVRYAKSGSWAGKSPEYFEFPAMRVKAGQSGRGSRDLPAIRWPLRTYLMLLGVYLADGNCSKQVKKGNWFVDITKIKEPNRTQLREALTAAGIKFHEAAGGTKVRIQSKQLYQHFQQFGRAWEKFIPAEVFDYAREDLEYLFQWLMWGDGHAGDKWPISYSSTSKQLADDVSRLLLHIGKAGNVSFKDPEDCVIRGKQYKCRRCYSVGIINTKLTPQVNHSHVKKQSAQTEEYIDGYDKPVFCVEVPTHVLYVRRNGKACWSGNSGRQGNKGVITVKPDEEMPQGEDGKAIEVIFSPLSVPSRGNSSFPLEMLLGKIARKRGQAYKIKDFKGEDLQQMVLNEADKYGVSDTETFIDPATGRKIKGVLSGDMFLMALHHTAESKQSSRGLGKYSAEDSPAKGGEEGAQAKRFSGQQLWAGLSHGAYATSKEASLLRGTRNDDYWSAFMAGNQVAPPKVPVQYNAFMDRLRASGINPVRRGTQTQLMAMTDNDVRDIAGDRVVRVNDTVEVHKDMKPVPGGLFDPRLFGDGTRFAAIELPERMPNPVFEEPLRRLLGYTEKDFREVLGGKKEIPGFGSGPDALFKRLEQIDVPKELSRARNEIAGTRKVARDAAVRRLGYLKNFEKTGTHPTDLMISMVPVMPPRLRPISKLGGKGGVVISDPNFLYRELMQANDVVSELKGKVDDISDERLAVYDAHKALVGVTDSTNRELQQRKVKGIIKRLVGSNPKSGDMQRKLLSGNVDTVGRGVIMPDTSLDMDSFGLPEAMAFNMFEPYVARNLSLKGIPRIQAMEHLKARDSVARKALLEEIGKRPVSLSRAPILYKYGDIALLPQLVKGDTIKLNPFVVKGLGADYDGDAVNLNVMHGREAVAEAMDRMLPSRMLFATKDFKSPMFTPSQDMLLGLNRASQPAKKGAKTRYFASFEDAKSALKRGDIDLDTPVRFPKTP